jgi:hypothetical protein
MGRISGSYHDWYLIAINTDITSKNVKLTLSCDNKRIQLIFQGVKQCIINNFTIGNIILEIYIYSAEIPIQQMLENKMFIATIGGLRDSPYFNEMVEKIEKGSLLYVEIQPSIGCFGGVICEAIEEVSLPNE